jgi:DNA repair exonuclease SbcCD ATPase subunit
MPMSYFNLLDDRTSFLEIKNIRSAQIAAQEALDSQADSAAMFNTRIVSLQKQVALQHDQIVRLQSALGVLAAVLRDGGLINAEILDARLEAATLNAEEEEEAHAVAANQTTCPRCGQSVDMRRTTMTANGAVCDRCFATGA